MIVQIHSQKFTSKYAEKVHYWNKHPLSSFRYHMFKTIYHTILVFRIVESPKQETTTPPLPPNTFSYLLILAPRIRSRKVKRHNKRGDLTKRWPLAKNQGGKKQKRSLSKLTPPPTEQADSNVEKKKRGH